VLHVTVHNSYVYIDQGVCLPAGHGSAATPPTVLEHRQFAYWVHGVAAARGRTSPPRPTPGSIALLGSVRAPAG
jgi:hypothetical protein